MQISIIIYNILFAINKASIIDQKGGKTKTDGRKK